MKEALKEARKAYKKDEVPVGAVIVKDFRTMCNVYGSNDSGKVEKGRYWNHG